MMQLMMSIISMMMKIRRGFRGLRELVGSRLRWSEVDGFSLRRRELEGSSWGWRKFKAPCCDRGNSSAKASGA